MDDKTSEHETLGEKHKHYNELLVKTLANKNIELHDINFDKYDQVNFLMIDIASEKKDVEYILNILKSEDMLYISRALQKCTWLYNDDQYAHIINPTYLYDKLLPEMTTKAGIKLIKSIRQHLKNEQRVEEFFKHEKNNSKKARHWLPNCSVQFIEDNVKDCADNLDAKTFRRLCEKSIKAFEILIKNNVPQSFYNSTMFLLNNYTDQYLDAIDKYYCPRFNAKATNIIMKNSPERITKKFEKYVSYINIPTFVKNMQKDHIKDFLLEQVSKDLNDSKYFYLKRFLNSRKVMHFIKRMPKEEQFEFVKTVFIDKIPTEKDEGVLPRPELLNNMRKLSECVCLPKHEWYIFAPFDIAFEEIKKMIVTDTNHNNKYSKLKTLVSCASKSEKDLQSLLRYYLNNHINDENRLKNQFISNLINNTKVYKCDKVTWKLLDDIFKSMDVYVEKDVDVQDCIILIILHHVLYNENVPEIINSKFSFDTLKRFGNKMNTEEKEKVFNFLYNYLLNKLNNKLIYTEKDFGEDKKTLESIFTLLVDWKKELVDFPFLIYKIKYMTSIKQTNSWKTDLSTLYNTKKSWRKNMFEESLLLNPSEGVCINALKHDPALLLRHKNEVQKICCDDKVSLKVLLSKLRIYWPESLAQNWVNAYQGRLDVMDGHKATTRGLCSLVPEKSLLKIIKKYAPKNPKINWKQIDELTFSLQKNFAKNMHISRPQLDPNAIFWYAKGDYLQFTLPSLLAVFYNMNMAQNREFIPKLLDAPVSVQKHGIRFAFLKLDTSKLQTIFSNIWNNSKNPTIRAELFKHTFKLLTNTQETAKVEEIGILLQLFIDNLTHKDDPKILNLLANAGEVPLNIRANYLIKSYNALKRMLPHFASKDVNRYKIHMQTLAEHSREVMESINDGFVVQIIQDFLDTEFFNSEGKCSNRVTHYHGMVKVISAYLLCTKDVETQRQRYEKILVPIIKRVFDDNNPRKESFKKDNFAAILNRLYIDLKDYVIEKNVLIPYQMFLNIQETLKSLPVPENYVILTVWKLTTALTKLLNENDTTCSWDEITVKIAPDFSDICTNYLEEDVNKRFSCIYVIFARSLKYLLNTMPHEAVRLICKGMLIDEEFTQAFLAVITILPVNTYLEETEKQQYDEIHKIILKHPSPEVKMHYYNAFKRYIGQ